MSGFSHRHQQHILFSVNGIMKSKKVFQGWHKSNCRTLFLWNGVYRSKISKTCSTFWKNNQVFLDSFALQFFLITWWSSFPLSLFLKKAMLIEGLQSDVHVSISYFYLKWNKFSDSRNLVLSLYFANSFNKNKNYVRPTTCNYFQPLEGTIIRTALSREYTHTHTHTHGSLAFRCVWVCVSVWKEQLLELLFRENTHTHTHTHTHI